MPDDRCPDCGKTLDRYTESSQREMKGFDGHVFATVVTTAGDLKPCPCRIAQYTPTYPRRATTSWTRSSEPYAPYPDTSFASYAAMSSFFF